MTACGIALGPGQPRHLCKSDDPIPNDDVILVELDSEEVVQAILANGCASC